MRKKNKKNKHAFKKNEVQSPLDLHNISQYIEDYAIISKFSHLPFSKREWIETRRYELQYSANKYEHLLGAFLLSHDVKFIHQAPFVINGNIYFLDFFIPSLRTAIEVDGVSHSWYDRPNKDSNRDMDFKTIGIKTIRISNDEVSSKKYLEIRLKTSRIIH